MKSSRLVLTLPYKKINAACGNAGITSDQLGEAIYADVTDGTSQMRYLVGPDAEQLVGLRQSQGDAA